MTVTSRGSFAPYLALLAAGASWGIATTLAKAAVTGLGPFTTLLIETGAAAAVLLPIRWLNDRQRPVRQRSIAFLALLEPIIAYGALNLGLLWADASQAALLDGTQTVMVLALSAIFLHQRPSKRALLCGVMASLGAVILVGGHVEGHVGLGSALILLGALGASGSVLVSSQLAAEVSALDRTAFPFALGFLVAIPMALVAWLTGVEQPPTVDDLPAVAAAALVGVVAFAGGYLAYNYAINSVSVAMAGAALSLIPIFGVASAVIWLDEVMTPARWLGGALVVIALLMFPADADQGDSAHPASRHDDESTMSSINSPAEGTS